MMVASHLVGPAAPRTDEERLLSSFRGITVERSGFVEAETWHPNVRSEGRRAVSVERILDEDQPNVRSEPRRRLRARMRSRRLPRRGDLSGQGGAMSRPEPYGPICVGRWAGEDSAPRPDDRGGATRRAPRGSASALQSLTSWTVASWPSDTDELAGS
jgi:hypothetical protein